MERIITQNSADNLKNAVSYEKAAALEKEEQKNEVLSCNQLLKNLLKTNLKLIKLNEISSVLLF